MLRILSIGLVCLLSWVYGNSQEVAIPYFEDFETGTTGDPGTLPTNWSQAVEGTTDNCLGFTNCHDWIVDSNGTGSGNTGPPSDHTPGGGNVNYLYIEASDNLNPEVRLESPSFDLEGESANLEFWIHNRNANNDLSHTLEVRIADANTLAYIDGGPIATFTQTEVNAWVFNQIDISSFATDGEIRVVFRWLHFNGAKSNIWYHDIAIDDVNIENTASVEICGNGGDDDGDGLIDCFDAADCDLNPICDLDSDGVLNRLDLDDDNDGIPDALECYQFNNVITNSGFESGNSGFSSDYSFQSCTATCGPSRDVDQGEYAIESDACRCGEDEEWTGSPLEGSSFMIIDFDNTGDVIWSQSVTVLPYLEYSFIAWALNISASNDTDPRIRLGVSTTGGAPYTIIGTSDNITEAQEWTPVAYTYQNGNNTSLTIAIISDNGGASGRELALDGLSFAQTDCDTDFDGVINLADLDSDNDGLYDVYESSSGEALSAGRLTGGVDSDGIPNSVTDSNGSIDYQIADSDNDGLIDAIELESDGDGCFDTFEEGLSDLDSDGIPGVGPQPVDGDGLLTSITYTAPAFNLWQSPGDENPACDNDSDDDGILDADDLDDDNDGIPDLIESPASINFTSLSLLTASDLNDLQVGEKVLYSNSIRDCNDIFYDLVVTITSIDAAGANVEATTDGLWIDQGDPSADDHFTFTFEVVESASATVLNPSGTPATIDDFILNLRDIDSSSPLTDMTELAGFSDSTPPDSFWLNPITNLEQAGYDNGGGPAGYTQFRVIPIDTSPNDWTDNSPSNTEDVENTVFLLFNEFDSVSFSYGLTGGDNGPIGARLTGLAASKECDRDGDGIPNRVDLDLDNDGIYDIYEAGHSETADLDGDGIIDGSDTGSGANGLFDGVETAPESGVVNYAYSNSDGDPDDIYDFFELDSDADLCFDTVESGISDDDVDGTAGSGAPSNDAFGRVDGITYLAPPTDNWQDSSETCLEICDNGLDDDGDDLIDEFDPDCAEFFLEAECGFAGANWVRTFDLDASNDDYQTIMSGLNSTGVPPTNGDDILRFTVTTLAAGTYRIIGRVNSATGADDSFWFRVDEGTWVKWNNWNTSGSWEWVEFHDSDNGNTATPYVLGIGSHTIDIAYREDGAGIDKIHLTINGSNPTGEGAEAINCSRFITTNLFLNYKVRNRNN